MHNEAVNSHALRTSMTCILLMLFEDAIGDHTEEALLHIIGLNIHILLDSHYCLT